MNIHPAYYGDKWLLTLGLVLGAYAVWLYACRRLGLLGQWHHEHFAIPLILLPWWWCWVLAVIVAWDDAVQHYRQLTNAAFESPLHALYRRTIWPWLNDRWPQRFP